MHKLKDIPQQWLTDPLVLPCSASQIPNGCDWQPSRWPTCQSRLQMAVPVLPRGQDVKKKQNPPHHSERLCWLQMVVQRGFCLEWWTLEWRGALSCFECSAIAKLFQQVIFMLEIIIERSALIKNNKWRGKKNPKLFFFKSSSEACQVCWKSERCSFYKKRKSKKWRQTHFGGLPGEKNKALREITYPWQHYEDIQLLVF